MSRHHEQIKNDPRYKAWQAEVVSIGYCQACGDDRDLTADHVVALDDGGDPFDLANGVCLCRSCNSRKGNRKNVRANYHNPKYLTRL